MAAVLKRAKGAPVSLILVSGIPGSGKGRLANTIAKLLIPLQLKTAFFKMPTVEQSTKYNTVDFIKYMHNNFFHLTATYRFDSNYKIFDSNMKWQINDAFNTSFDFYSTKTHFAAAIISNCNDKSKRLDYIRKIQKYINVDIFGQNSCRTKLCPQKVKINHSFINDTDCKEIIANEYKFFFALIKLSK